MPVPSRHYSNIMEWDGIDERTRYNNPEMKVKLFAVGVFVIGILAPPLARATLEKKHWEINLSPGYSLPGGNSNKLENNCFALGLSGEYMWSKKLSAGLELGEDFRHNFDGPLVADVDHDGIRDTLLAQGNVAAKIYRAGAFLKWGSVTDWGVWNTRWARKFLIFGAGLYHYEVNSGELNLVGTSSTGINWDGRTFPVPGESHNHFGINVGAGMEIEVWGHGLVGFEVRYHRFFRSAPDAEYWIPSLKFGYSF